MNLGISHLAFRDNIEVQHFAPHIKSLGINSLELVFAKGLDIIFDCGLNIKSTQSLLHQSNVNDFLDENMFDTIVDISNKCSMCNINLMVLGSPKQRRIFDYERLLDQFTKIDNLLKGRNQILCIEPNAKEYGGKYFYTISEIVNFLIRSNSYLVNNSESNLIFTALVDGGSLRKKDINEYKKYTSKKVRLMSCDNYKPYI